MAIGQSDGSIILTTSVEMAGLKKGINSIKSLTSSAGKAFAAVGLAAAAASVAITKMAVSAYADYEQLVGGVETLFKDSAGKVLEYANQAFATAGMSANEYMKNVTSFSASLISSTAGDTEKAADIANMAMIDMSDNANKMGSSLESVTLAYQGFAKGQYMLLDNLKLGYGGTKTEMERLLKDAEAYLATQGKTAKFSLDNLADVYTAINAIQQKLDIAGTTAKEAEKTISGSANMMKAAWENVLAAISGGGDLDRAINNLVYSVQKYFENIVPVVERALQGIGTLIEKAAPLLVQTVAKALIKAIPSLLNAVYQMIIGLAKGIYEGIVALFSGGAEQVLEKQTNEIKESVKNQNALTEAVEETAEAQEKTLAGFDKLNIFTSNATENTEGLSLNTVAPSVEKDMSIDMDTKQAEKELLPFFKKILQALQPIIDVTKQWIKTLNFEPIKQGFSYLLSAFSKIGEFFQSVMFWAYTEILLPLSTWTINEFAPTLIDVLTKAFEGLKNILQPVWDGFRAVFDYMSPIFDWIGTTAIDILKSFGDMFSNVGKVFEKKGGKIREIFDIIGKAIQSFWELVKPIFNWIKNIVVDVFDTIDEIIGGVIDTLYDLTYFLKYVFQGDWKNAWNSIVSVFKNIVNIIIDALNILVRGVNKISFKAPDWIPLLGGKKWGFNIPEIPRLATGAVIPPNNEFMAILGDQKSGRNLEAPEDLIRQIVREESGGKNFTIKATGSMSQLIRMLNLQITEEQNRVSVF